MTNINNRSTVGELLASFDLTDRKFERETDYLSLFCELKSRGAFNKNRQAAVRVSVDDYASASRFCNYLGAPARIVIGDYEMLLDC